MRLKRVIACSTLIVLVSTTSVALRAISAENGTSSVSESSSGDKSTDAVRCKLREEPDGWWFVTPAGKRFFSLGICVFSQGSDRTQYDPMNPSFGAWRFYDSPSAWAHKNVQQLKSWGFTTLGGWSDYAIVEQSGEHDLWMTPEISIGAKSGAPWLDMWDEKVVQQVDQLAKESITPFRDNGHVIGYYSDNELGWWNAILWKMALEQPTTSGQRQRLVSLVREKYKDDWQKLTEDFEPENASNWSELEQRGMLWLRPGSNGIRTMRQFLGIVADRYYQVMRDAIHKYDPHALYLGDRYQSFYYPEVAAASRSYVDVVSTNLNASWSDGTFVRSYLDTLHELSGKPILASEFYLAAAENGSGDTNKNGGFPTVATQKDRADAVAKSIYELASLQYVVGADWFQYYDEPPKGREPDGEDFNFGLVDVQNNVYTDVTKTFASLDATKLKSAKATKRPDATAGVPPASRDPLSDFQSMTALKCWDRENGFVPPSRYRADRRHVHLLESQGYFS